MSSPLRNQLLTNSSLIHLNNAANTPLSRAAHESLTESLGLCARGNFDLPLLKRAFEKARTSYARLLGCKADDIAFTQSTSTALSQVALGLSLHPGDEILIWDQEYPANVYPWWEAARRSGAQVRILASEPDLSINSRKLLESISKKTRIVSVSWVQYQSGEMLPLPELAEACHAVDALLVVDGIQGIGAMPFQMDGWGVDVVCGASHKWLMGPFGVGYLAVSSRARDLVRPIVYGPRTFGEPYDTLQDGRPFYSTARRYEPGSMGFPGIIAAAAAVDAILNVGLESVSAHNRALKNLLLSGLSSLGLETLGRPQISESSILAFAAHSQNRRIQEALVSAQVSIASLPKGLRFSPHAFNTREEIEKVIEIVRSSLR